MPSATHPTLAAALETLEAQCELNADTLRAIAARFRERLVHGLSHDGANMACIPSFVTGVPDGTEIGTYLALDLGGTNLRCCQVKLSGGGQFTMKQEKYKVSDALKTGPAHDLFAYIAKSIGTFLKDYGDQEDCAKATRQDPLLVGFTFSFPVEQTAIDRGTLIKWTKGFNCPDAPGMEVVSLLQSCIDEAGIPARVNALVNDTVGALLAHGYQQGGALIGGIFGTGTNGAYVESVERIQKMNPEFAHGESTMIINTEWGGFDDERAALPITLFDNVVDRTSIRPRHHAFEKMISGMYLGELVRAVLIHLIDSLHLFDGYSSAKMNEQYAFDTAYVSAVLADQAPEGATSPTRAVILQTMGMDEAHVSEQDLKTVKRVCEIVGRRAGRLSAVAIAAVVQHTGHDQRPQQESIDVGVDGSVYEHLPHFEEWLREGLRDLLGEQNEKRVKIDLAKDGSGVGAALCALQAKKQADRAHARRQTM